MTHSPHYQITGTNPQVLAHGQCAHTHATLADLSVKTTSFRILNMEDQLN